MSLLPTRDDTCVKVVFVKQPGGDASMPTTINCFVESMPLLRGVTRKIVHTPYFNLVTTTATTTSYKPEAGTALDLIGRYRQVIEPMFRGSQAVSAGTITYDVNDAEIFFQTTATSADISEARLEIETTSY